MNKNSRIFVAGATGLVGSAIIRELINKGYSNILGSYNNRKPDKDTEKITYKKINLIDQNEVSQFFRNESIEYIFLAAAKVGGIVSNSIYRAQFIYENLQMQNNIIHNAYKTKVKKLLFLGSSCIYPKNCPQPMSENHLLTSELEYTNEPYAIAKIAGIKMCESYNLQYGTNFIAVMPTNLFGPNDNFHLENSHVLPALIRKLHLAKLLDDNNFSSLKKDFNKNPIEGIDGNASEAEIIKILKKHGIKQADKTNKTILELWGSGNPRREFLHSDDLAEATVFVMENLDFSDILNNDFNIQSPTFPISTSKVINTHINIGVGKDISIRELAELIKSIVGFTGNISWNTNKPDGTFQKLLNVNKLSEYGWSAKLSFKDSIVDIYDNYKQ